MHLTRKSSSGCPGRQGLVGSLLTAGLLALVVLSSCLFSPRLAAQGDFFMVETGVDDRLEASREQAIERGLEQLIGIMTGEYQGLDEDHPAYGMLAEAERHLEGYRYTRLNGELGVELRFDASSIKAELGEREVAVWGRHRRPLLVWAFADFNGQRVMLSDRHTGYTVEQLEVVEALRTQARERGLPLLFPLLDWQDRRSLGYADVWGGFTQNIREASERYGGAAVISVGLRRTSTGAWRGHWTAILGEESIAYRSGPGALDEVIGDALDLIGQRFVERYAAIPGDPEGRRMEVVILGIEGLEDYVAMQRRLRQIAGVDAVNIRRVEGRRAMLELVLSHNMDLVLEDLDDLPQLLVEPLPSVDFGEEAGRVVRAYRWRGDR
nr:DUF2066 domain-containing protein [Halorhodospira halochloris]